ncbi:MAG: hypothetical protein QM612_06230 [Thermomonas sp.]|uniref:hypothetical protein n=1 Tax=Thermomonas sp. TaxID=1971895 RepID=UPI0039E2D274
MSQLRAIAGIAIALTLLHHGQALAQAKPAASKKIYCWNEGGKKVCGDALPASAANSARTEISTKSGMTTGRVDRALTDDERTAAEIAAAAARKQAEAIAAQERRDLAMVDSYTTENDLRRAYGERISLLDETIKSSKMGIGGLRLSLLSELRQAGDQELAGAPVTKRLTDSIRGQHAELLRQRQILSAQEEDRAALKRELLDSVRRYREMKGEAKDTAAPQPAAEAAQS